MTPWLDILQSALPLLAIAGIVLCIKPACMAFMNFQTHRKLAHIRSEIDAKSGAMNAQSLTFSAEKSACLAEIQDNPFCEGLHFLDFIYVAGTRYYNIASANSLQHGDFLQAIREPHNPHDCNAIRLCTKDGAKIGYVPRKYNSIPVAMIDHGYSIKIKVYSAYKSPEAPVIRAQIYIGKAEK